MYISEHRRLEIGQRTLEIGHWGIGHRSQCARTLSGGRKKRAVAINSTFGGTAYEFIKLIQSDRIELHVLRSYIAMESPPGTLTFIPPHPPRSVDGREYRVPYHDRRLSYRFLSPVRKGGGGFGGGKESCRQSRAARAARFSFSLGCGSLESISSTFDSIPDHERANERVRE